MDQLGVTLEVDAVHLPRFALVPVRPREDLRPRRHRHRVVGHVGFEQHTDVAVADIDDPRQELEARVAAGHARLELPRLVQLLGQRGVDLGVLVATERRRHPIDGRQEVEPAEPELVLGELRSRLPRGGTDADPQFVVRLQMTADDRVAQLGLEGREHAGPQVVGRLRLGRDGLGLGCQPTTSGSPLQRDAMSSCWMRSCSSTMPSSSASGRGGQPGTYTSTGMIWSTPLVTE